MDIIAGLLQTSILAGGVLALAALGEVLAERVGVVNLGVEGLMALGAITGIATVIATPSPVLGFIAALGVGLLVGMIFAGATVILRANQVLCGLALTLMGTGLAATIGKAYSGMPAPATFAPVAIPYLSEIPLIGRAVFTQNILVYLIYIILPAVLHFIMFRTRHGLNLRAVGENPAAADAAGIAVQKFRFCYVAAGASLASGAGAYLTLAFVPSWSEGVVAGRGWIAVALVVFATWRPARLLLGAYLFGGITILQLHIQAWGLEVPSQFLTMLPYLATVLVLVLISRHSTRIRLNAPACLGRPFHAAG
jgi:simple sugar transport system permease protein